MEYLKSYILIILRVFLFFKYYLIERFYFKRKHFNCSIASQIYSKGFYLFDEVMEGEKIELLAYDFESALRSNKLKTGGQENNRLQANGIVRPILNAYLDEIKPILDDYFGSDGWKVEISYYQRSIPEADIDNVPGGEFHVDDNKSNLKYFIYLDEVTSLNGPFSCVPMTHQWRLKNSFMRGLHWAVFQERKSLYSLGIDQSRYEKIEYYFVGPSGTHFIVDTTALHRARPVAEGQRRVVVMSFNRR